MNRVTLITAMSALRQKLSELFSAQRAPAGYQPGRTLGQLPADTRLPWHRVLAAGGRLSLALGTPSGDEQRARLRAEGVNVSNNRVDMTRHGWRPMEHSG